MIAFKAVVTALSVIMAVSFAIIAITKDKGTMRGISLFMTAIMIANIVAIWI